MNDLDKSKEFFSKLGFTFNPQFTDQNGACMIIDEDHIYVMLIVPTFFKTFTTKEIADATRATEVITALSMDSREAVDTIVDTALANGATVTRATEDHGWMYLRSINDLDGHIREFAYMDVSAFPQQS